ncbi:MAG: hypothetical protein WAV10_00550 [Minisyncoccia bacterium]
MKKMKNLLAIILISFAFILPSFSSAQITPTLTTSDLTATSVTLNATGLIPSNIYKFKINGASGFIEQQFTASSAGAGSVSFGPPNFHLEVYSDFVASVSEYNPNTGISSNAIATLNFKTLGPNFFVSNVTENSVTLNATGLVPFRAHRFEIVGASGSPAQEVVVDVDSNAHVTFNNLASGHNYTAKVSLIGSETTFYGSISIYFTTLSSNSNNNTNTNNTTSSVIVGDNNDNSSSSSGSSNQTNINNTASCPSTGLVPVCPEGGCGFAELICLVNNFIQFILFRMAVPIAAIMFAYAGILLIFSGGDTSKRSKAKSIFANVAIGLIIAIAAWLIVETILTLLGYDQSWTTWLGF